MSQALRSIEGDDTAAPAELHAADVAVQDLAAAIQGLRGHTDDDLFAAGTIVTAIRRAVAALVDNGLAHPPGIAAG
jgi:hypothetical protein